MAENSIHVRKRGFHLGIRPKIMIPVILTNIFIGVVLSVVIMDDFKKQCIETGAQGGFVHCYFSRSQDQWRYHAEISRGRF